MGEEKKQDEETAYSSKWIGRRMKASQRQCATGMARTASRSAVKSS